MRNIGKTKGSNHHKHKIQIKVIFAHTNCFFLKSVFNRFQSVVRCIKDSWREIIRTTCFDIFRQALPISSTSFLLPSTLFSRKNIGKNRGKAKEKITTHENNT